jgi:hypothetical protein
MVDSTHLTTDMHATFAGMLSTDLIQFTNGHNGLSYEFRHRTKRELRKFGLVFIRRFDAEQTPLYTPSIELTWMGPLGARVPLSGSDCHAIRNFVHTMRMKYTKWRFRIGGASWDTCVTRYHGAIYYVVRPK